MKKTVFSVIFIFIMMLSLNVYAWEQEKTIKIQDGITYKNILKYENSEFKKLHIIECDLEDERVSIGVMTAEEGSSYLETTKSMAENYGAIAAINGDFFNTGSSRTNALGMIYQSGELVSSPSKDLWATFTVTNAGEILMDYFGFSGKIISPQGYEIELYQINKVPPTGGAVTMLTEKWGKKVSLAENMSAMLISGDEVIEIVSEKGDITFEECDKMLITNHQVNGFFSNFAIGDKVIIDYAVADGTLDIKEAVGGNTLLVVDGKEAYFNHNISGKAQRTAIGVNKEGTKLYMMVADGRTHTVGGLTQNQMADEMIKLGAYTAINLDGGGSSSMVYKNDFSGDWEVLNSYTSLRKVSNSVGIFNNTEYSGIVDKGEIKPASDTVLKGDYLDIYYKFTDKNGHIVYPENEEVTISTDNKNDVISGNRIYFNEGGKRQVSVSFDGATVSEEIYVIDEVANILIYPENVLVSEGKETPVSVTVWDDNGKKAYVHPESIDWIEEGAEVNKGKVGYGVGYIGIEIDGCFAFSSVNDGVAPKNTMYKSEFNNGEIDGGKKIRFSAGSERFTSIADMIRTLNFEYSLEDADEIYLLNGTLMRDLEFESINIYSEKSIDDTKIITVNSKKGTINTGGQINKLLNLTKCSEKNIIIATSNDLSGMSEEETAVFSDVLNMFSESGKNVFYLYNDRIPRCYFENGVTFIGYPDVTKENSSNEIFGLGTSLDFYIKNQEISFSFN